MSKNAVRGDKPNLLETKSKKEKERKFRKIHSSGKEEKKEKDGKNTLCSLKWVFSNKKINKKLPFYHLNKTPSMKMGAQS